MTGPQEICLLTSLRGEWIKLPMAVVRESGPAAQTLGGLLSITNRETFSPVVDIARRARLKMKTARNHLKALAAAGWIINAGRGHTRRGAPRRTCTIKITGKTTAAIKPTESDGDLVYGVLPWWGCASGMRMANGQSSGPLSWATKVLLSVVMARLMSLLKTIEDAEGKADLHTDEPWGSISNLGDEDRFRFSLRRLTEITGMDHKTITGAKQELHRQRIVCWRGDKRSDGGDACDILMPSESFRVVVTPTDDTHCRIAFKGDGKNGQ